MLAQVTKLETKNSKLKTKIIEFLTFTFCVLTLTPFASTVSAQIATTSATTVQSSVFSLQSSVSPTSPLYTDILVHNLFHTASCLMAGFSIIGQPCLTYQVTRDAQGMIKSVPVLSQTNLSGGLLGAEASIIDQMYLNRPIKASDYLATIGEDMGIKEAHAQVIGSGQAVLNPVIKLWQVSRNVAYLFMIFVFIIIGLMVMFRQRINPQTVITAQTAIPGLVIGLILITFSYFLAALISDMAFIGTNLVGFYFSAASGAIQPNLVNDLSKHNVLDIFSQYLGGIDGALGQHDITGAMGMVFNAMGTYAQNAIRFFVAVTVFVAGASLGGGVGGVGGTAIGALTSVIAGTFAAVLAGSFPVEVMGWLVWILSIAILIFSMFRLLLRLINNFLSIIFLTISAPFHFLAASLPGRQNLATAWILNMLCNVLAFPAVIAVFYFVAFILGKPVTITIAGVTDTIFPISGATSITGTIAFPLFGGLNLSFINLLIAFGALVATPAIPDIICRTIGRVGIAGELIGRDIQQGLAGQRYWGELAEGGRYAGRSVGGVIGGWRDQPGWSKNEDGEWERIYDSRYGARPGLPGILGGYRRRKGEPRPK